MAGRFNSKLIVLHVLETTLGQPGDLDFGGLATSLQWEHRTERAQEMLNEFQKEEFASLNVERRLEAGDAARTIVKVAKDEGVDMIMMPTHGYGGFRRFILGSVSAKVLHDAECAVWTAVHMENAPPLDDIATRHVMCALDLTAKSSDVLQVGAQLAEEYGAKLTLVHAVPGSEAIPERILDCELRRHLLAQAREQLTGLCAKAGVKAALCTESGDVAAVVERCARSNGADLLVIGRTQHTGFGRLRTHSYAIIRQSPCPVLSI
jgi:nucleotide-binding universal stress UspA family protein